MNKKKQEEWITLTDNLLAKIETLDNKIVEQAAVIESLRETLNSCREMFYPYPGSSHPHRALTIQAIKRALSFPTDSKQFLVDWMREQLGEPTAYAFEDGSLVAERNMEFVADKTGQQVNSLYKLPEFLK